MKRDKIDVVFSNLVRERANWTCESCHKYYPEGQRQGLHCSHFYSRIHKRTRHDPLNAAAHCFSCHKRLGGNPLEFSAWIRQHIGPVLAEELHHLAHSICKRTKAEKESLYQHLKAELKSMQAKRMAGETGYLEFTAYD